MTLRPDPFTEIREARGLVARFTGLVPPHRIAALEIVRKINGHLDVLEREAAERETALAEASQDADELSIGIAEALGEVRSLMDELRQANFFRDRLAERIERAETRVREVEAERDRLAGVFISTLAHHALVEIRCDHDAKQDLPVCNCALVDLGWHPTVQAAKEAWAQHVWAVLASPEAAATEPRMCPKCGGCLDGLGHSNDCPVLRADDLRAAALPAVDAPPEPTT